MTPASTKKEIVVKAQNGLRAREVKKFLEILQKRELELLVNLTKPMGSLGRNSDPCDEATVSTDMHLEDSLRRVKSNELKDVQAAIERIKKGEFGECQGGELKLENDECNGQIEKRILEGSAVGTFCRHCLAELKEKRSRTQGVRETEFRRAKEL